MHVVLAALTIGFASNANTHMIDLATGTVDGHRVLGRTVAGVTAGLGRPDFRSGRGNSYRIGWGTPTNFGIEVLFRRESGAERAWSVVLRRGPVADVKIGDLLNRPSLALQKLVAADYGTLLSLVRPYRCRASGVCSGEFAGRVLHLTFGRQSARGAWVTMWKA